jgi:hypothetical protein
MNASPRMFRRFASFWCQTPEMPPEAPSKTSRSPAGAETKRSRVRHQGGRRLRGASRGHPESPARPRCGVRPSAVSCENGNRPNRERLTSAKGIILQVSDV